MPRKRKNLPKKVQDEVVEEEAVTTEPPKEGEGVKDVRMLKREKLKEKKENLKEKLRAEKEKINSEMEALQKQENIDKIKDIVCANCGEPLNPNPEDFMQGVLNQERLICTNCHMMNKIRVTYDGTPELSEAQIEVKPLRFAYAKLSAGSLTPEQIKARIDDEVRRVDNQTNKQQPIIKIMLKHIQNQDKRIAELEQK